MGGGEAAQAGHVDEVAGAFSEAGRSRVTARRGELDLREPCIELERRTLRQCPRHVLPDVGVAAGELSGVQQVIGPSAGHRLAQQPGRDRTSHAAARRVAGSVRSRT